MSTLFVGREAELKLLDDLAAKEESQFLVVYGRRRVGKSRLLIHWATTRERRFLYWVARETTHADSLRNFSKALYEFLHPEHPLDKEFSYFDWEEALLAVATYAKEHPFILILDEFTYAMESSRDLASVLQYVWDRYFKETKLFLVISGSQVHMMMKAVHSYHAPLYGRASARIHLRPLNYRGIAGFLPNYNADELIAVQAIMDGIPAYLEKLDPQKNFSENLRQVLVQPNTLMQSDAVLLLHEQFEEPGVYTAILNGIAHNKRTPKDIATFADIPHTHISRYLNILVEIGIIERQVPVTDMDKANSRKGRYVISDAYLRFYFRFIAPDLALLEMQRSELIIEKIKHQMRAYVGEHAFEKLCRLWTVYTSANKKAPLSVDRFGSYWGSDAQMDVMATDSYHKKVLLGECKWGLQPIEVEVIEKLARQAPKVVSHLPDAAKWKTYLYLFSRTELTPEAAARAKELQVEIISLERLDHDLRQEV